jgi:hypothetical protein
MEDGRRLQKGVDDNADQDWPFKRRVEGANAISLLPQERIRLTVSQLKKGQRDGIRVYSFIQLALSQFLNNLISPLNYQTIPPVRTSGHSKEWLENLTGGRMQDDAPSKECQEIFFFRGDKNE